MEIREILNHRYSCKAFDKNKKISESRWQDIETSMQLCPSSINSQPWHFVIATDDAGKQRLAKGTESYPFNTDKILSASHVALFCSKTTMEDDYLDLITEQEKKDGRFLTEESRDQMHGARVFFADLHRKELSDTQHWNEKQVYLNIGQSLLAAAGLNIQALPMEGIDINALNEELQLGSKGLSAVAIVCFGYAADEDYNRDLPKSRLRKSDIFTHL